ncbi:hypothetical protein GCM10011497_32330 [Elstera cyanobacteriorum]|uniref:NACHT domain-containing protein n=1 Tax=Elstera cyanobacteriorum TaxID=2022747 RepID=A0A255XUF8_9PROT|nr:NACHT domain-containing protein [Elstera cyanobacteriorum]OYQ20542.1 hypothetical protein CHR90_03970 [Elstera cyanobacteriorum]GFZ99266.1 hypothetical protein GCM10011497_32330 [Elstera cyanobacteriorum]
MVTGPEFEDQVRNIARNLYSHGMGYGSELIDGRERDGVFWNGQVYTVIEATILRKKEKAEEDGKKTHELVNKYRSLGHLAQGILVTLHEPTPDQKNIIKEKKYHKTTKIISFDELRSYLFDSLLYINNREKKRFGSVYDHIDNNYDIPLSDFVEPTISLVEGGSLIDFKDLSAKILGGERFVLVAEYGVGKSMILRHLFHRLVAEVRGKRHFRTPIAINLREHLGQIDPVELLERHARANATSPQNLVAAWNAGYVDLLIDGFDELSTRGWTGDIRRLREYRKTAHSVVRKLIKETPKGSGIIISGRDGYFDSLSELREALGVADPQFSILRVHSFDEEQTTEFLKRKKYNGVIPEWFPTRPLLLTYLEKKGLLSSVEDINYSGDFPRGAAWLSLIEMIAVRESEQLEGVDKDALIIFLGALSIQARHAPDNQISFSPQKMEEIFSHVTGYSVMEDERNLLLRLPGLGVAQDNVVNRSFIDNDFMNVCSSFATLSYTKMPFEDYTKQYGFEYLSSPMSSIGIEALAALFVREKIHCGVIISSLQRALSLGYGQLAFDIFSAAQHLCPLTESLTFSGVSVSEIDLSDNELGNHKILFTDSIINKINLPMAESTNKNISFSNCIIGRIEGRRSDTELELEQFKNCDVGEYDDDDYRVNNQVMGADLPIGMRVLIVTLRKLFLQGGAGRLESALYRGLDQRSKMIVPDIIDILLRHQFIVANSRKGRIIYSTARGKRGEAVEIIQSMGASSSRALKEAATIS